MLFAQVHAIQYSPQTEGALCRERPRQNAMLHTPFFMLTSYNALRAAFTAVFVLLAVAPAVLFAANTKEELRVVSEAELEAMLSQARGTPFIVVYWASWCSPCRHFRTKMEKIREEYPESALSILAVSVDDVPERAREYLTQKGLPYPSVLCAETLRKSLLGLPVPTTRLYRRDGGLEKELSGDISLLRLEHYVRRILEIPSL